MVAERLFAGVCRVLVSWGDLAAVWEARHLVANVQVCRRGSRAIEVAERKAAVAELDGLMAEELCGSYNLGMAGTIMVTVVGGLPAAVWLRVGCGSVKFRRAFG